MLSNIPVLTNFVSYCIILYRYKLIFLYGSTCSLVDNTKYILQLENFPRFYGEDGAIRIHKPLAEKDLEIIIGGKHRWKHVSFNEFYKSHAI